MNWSGSVVVSSSVTTRVYVRYLMSYEGTTTPPNALASVTFQPVFANVRLDSDGIAPFLSAGTNTTGGAIDSRLDFSQPGGFGRIKPWAATGPTTSQAYVIFQHAAGSGSAPPGTYYRLARNDISRWVGVGPTAGTVAINNFNGGGGIAFSQKQIPIAGDPPRVAGTTDLVLMVLALDVGGTTTGSPFSIDLQVPTLGISRNATTGVREALWWANTVETVASIKAPVTVIDGRVQVIPCVTPVITQQPRNVSVCQPAPVTLSVTATGGDFSYQWRKNGNAIPGANAATFSIPSTQVGDSGTYDCRISNLCRNLVTSAATVQVGDLPEIISQPSSAPVCEGASPRLEIVLRGTQAATFQWRKDGANLPGATASSYTLPPFTPADAGSYDCIVTNSCGTVNSTPVQLTPGAGTIPSIVSSPAAQSVCAGQVASFSVAASGSNPIAYQWRRNGTVIVGAQAATLQLTTVAADAGSYDCVVSNICGSIASAPARGTAATMPVTLTPAPTGARWYRNGVLITDDAVRTGTTSATLAWSGLRASDQGTYQFEAVNACGSVRSTSARLTLTSCQQTWTAMPVLASGARWMAAQAYDPISESTLVHGGRDASGNVRSDTLRRKHNAWSTVSGTTPGPRSDHAMVTLGTSGVLLFGGKSSAADASCLNDTWLWNGTSWAQVATSGPAPRGGHAMWFDARRGRVVLFGGFGADSTILADTWEWDGAAWSRVLVSGPPARCGSAAAFDPVLGKGLLFGGFGESTLGDTWAWDGSAWTQVATGGPEPRYYAAAAFHSSLGRVILFGGADLALYNDAWTWNGTAWSSVALTTPPVARWTHTLSFDDLTQQLVVVGGAGEAIERSSDVAVLTDRPIITVHPSNLSGCQSGSSLTVAAIGTGPFTYQWRRNGVNFTGPGATTASVTISGASNEGTFDCVVRNGCGESTSAAAAVTLNPTLAISTQPASVVVCLGSSHTLSIGLSGGGERTFQWHRSGVGAIAGATQSTYTIAAMTQADEASYFCIVSSTCGQVTSAAADVRWEYPIVAPVLTGGSTCSGSPFTLQATVTSRSALLYEWLRNGVVVPGASTIALAISTPGQTGSYHCRVTSGCSSVTSLPVTVDVLAVPTITQNLTDQLACATLPASLSLAAAGSSPLTYRWYFRPAGQCCFIQQATNAPTLAIGSSAAGQYYCEVANACGTVTSSTITVGRILPPVISPDPVSGIVARNAVHTLTSGSLPLTPLVPESYQWYRNGVPVQNSAAVSGAQTPVLTLQSFNAGQQGAYTFRTTNSCFSTQSQIAELQVQQCATGWYSTGATGMGERWVHAQAFDAGAGGTLVFGGRDRLGRTLGDTWSSADGSWRRVATSGPAARSDHAMVSMGAAGILLFGGKATAADASCLNDTWIWRAGAWTPVAATGPSPRGGHSMVFDAARGNVLLFGGFDATSNTLADTWQFDGTIWTQLAATGPSARFAAAMAYDPARNTTVLFGGYGGGIKSDTWVWNGSVWTLQSGAVLAGRYYAAAAFNPDRGRILLHGGAASTILNSEYSWNGTGWQLESTTPKTTSRWAHGMSHDPIANCMVVTGGAGTALTRYADAWSQSAAPIIAVQPRSATSCGGSSVTFSVSAIGAGPFTYAWSFMGTPIANATQPSLTVTSPRATEVGAYTCTVSNACSSTTSSLAMLTLAAAPVIVTQPQPTRVCAGGTAQLSVVASGDPLPSYQWRRNGTPIARAVASNLEIQGATAQDAGSYDCIVSNACGAVTSDGATLTVGTLPTIVANPQSVSTCLELSATFTVEFSGQPAPTFQWFHDGLVVQGATSSSLTIGSLTNSDAGTYWCELTGTCGSTRTTDALLSVLVPVEITQDPLDVTTCIGATVSFTAQAQGSGPLQYQWRRDGVAIPGASSPVLEVVAAPQLAGLIDCMISNSCSSAGTAAATLLVTPAPQILQQPVSVAGCPGDPVSFSIGLGAGVSATCQWRFDGQPIAGATLPVLSLASVSAADVGTYDCLLTFECGSAISNTASLTLGDAPSITTSPADVTVCIGASTTLRAVAASSASLTYQWRRNGSTIAGAEASTLIITPLGSDSAGVYDCVVSNGCGSATSTPASVTVIEPVRITSQPAAAVVCSGRTHTLTVNATGSSPLTYRWRRNGVDVAGANASSLDIIVGVATQGNYDCQITNACGSLTTLPAAISLSTPTSITLQPLGGQSCEGQNFTLTVAAAGQPPLTYQWRRDGTVIPGATSEQLSLVSALPTQSGVYDCVVTGTCGSVSSDPATLAIAPNVRITRQPASVPYVVGANALFTLETAGGRSPSFQWRRLGVPLINGGRISGATTPTLTIQTMQAADESSYDCIVTDTCGSVTSDTVQLTCRPIFTVQPESGGFPAGASVQLTTTVNTAGTVTYRWRKDGSSLFNSAIYSGVLTPVLTINSTDPSQSGDYQLVATKSCGATTSQIATVVFSCVSDFNQDGGVDGSDIEAFFVIWETGDGAADVNQDGGVDGSDVDVFFAAWESGC
ncbi:MAG: immunoglobulin domain-containing protein [Planctomycetota bacterium]|nr:immunoglobulin domain-containing protein [Planctomycetota bacterium]